MYNYPLTFSSNVGIRLRLLIANKDEPIVARISDAYDRSKYAFQGSYAHNILLMYHIDWSFEEALLGVYSWKCSSRDICSLTYVEET